MWERDEPAAAASADDEAGANGGSSGTGGARESVQVVVTDVVDAGSFCVQLAGEPRVDWIAEQMAELGLEELPPPPVRWGELLATCAGGGCWCCWRSVGAGLI